MATTIQIVENLQVGKYVEIDGKHCEVEAVSRSLAITEKSIYKDLFEVMSNELLSREIVTKDRTGTFYWTKNNKPLIVEDWYED
ncbi:hypothetical protein [Photobacterium kishitanii]|uniref:Uncharacterized protein n=1 Tax=Photobacterium kishitanii TaxID=318456 RepID=A0A2T3KMP1_9GAMM|nr:hypothetical protein [Photobacterium kishitanii]PSV01025.1 hypothetical protein C9J27_03075 [Photobacterium kishitanii]